MNSPAISDIVGHNPDLLEPITAHIETVGSVVTHVSHHLYNGEGAIFVLDGNTPHKLLTLDEPCCLRITIERLDIEPDEFEALARRFVTEAESP